MGFVIIFIGCACLFVGIAIGLVLGYDARQKEEKVVDLAQKSCSDHQKAFDLLSKSGSGF